MYEPLSIPINDQLVRSAVLCVLLLFPFQTEKLKGKVIAISDGDTITLFIDPDQKVKVRLNGIDCPEKSQDFGNRSKEYTSILCFGKFVTVNSSGEDRYGRTLGEVVLPDGRVLNQELVKEGLAWHYKKYSNDTTLANLEMIARKNKKGLWSQSKCIPPWEFRKMQTNPTR